MNRLVYVYKKSYTEDAGMPLVVYAARSGRFLRGVATSFILASEMVDYQWQLASGPFPRKEGYGRIRGKDLSELKLALEQLVS